MNSIKNIYPVSRFVWAVRDPVALTGPRAVGTYLQKNVFTPFEQFEQEEIWVLLLDARNRLTHQMMVYRGTVSMAPVRLSEMFREAVRFNAVSLIMAHNHPSGDPTPSAEDRQITRKVKEAGSVLEVKVLDHLIVGSNRWVSLKEQGM